MLFGWHKNLRHLTPNITSCYSHKNWRSYRVSYRVSWHSLASRTRKNRAAFASACYATPKSHMESELRTSFFFHFYRAMLCISGTSHGPVSVRLSVTSGSSTKMAKRRITRTTPIVQGLEDLHEIRPGSPPAEAPNAGGVGQNRRLSTNNRLYLENGTSKTVSIKVE